MMAIFGWTCLVIMLLVSTAAWLIMWLNHGGQHTIGGASNSLMARITINLIGVGIFFTWYLVFAEVPFTLALK